MVDFRYHIVSIVAIFLALAIGIVLGTNVLSGDVLDNLKHQTSDLRSEAQTLRQKVSDQQNQLNQQQGFLNSLAPSVISGRLTGQRVVMFTAPGVAGSMRSNLQRSIERAGAKLTGTVQIQAAYSAADERDLLDSLARSLAIPEVVVPDGVGTYGRVAAQLAAALVTPPTSVLGPGLELSAPARTLLAGLADDGFIKAADAPSLMSTMALVVVPAAPDNPSADDARTGTALVDLAQALQPLSGGVVMAGTTGSAATGGAVGSLRESGATSKVSGVDDADTSQGQIAVILALQGALSGQIGQYGIGPGATAIGPTPSPRPSPSPSKPPGLPEVPGTLPTPTAGRA